MRLIPIILLSVALATASAGCFGKDDGDDPPMTTTTPTGTGVTPPTGGTPTTTPTSPTSGGNTTPPTPAVMPKVLCTVAKNFDQLPATPGETASSTGDCGAVTAGYRTATLEGNWTAATALPANVNQGVQVLLVDAAGAVVATCAGPGPGPMQTATACAPNGGPVTVGAYSFVFDGSGSIRFDGTVTIS